MDRWVDFSGVFNFRDAGALAGRPGLLYRSDALCSLLDEDRVTYEALGVRTVIDLRRPEEVESQGRAPEWAYASWHNLTLRETVWPVGECADREAVAIYLSDVYLGMSGADITRVLTVLAETSGPAVIHCAGGRDRTGVIVAIVLELLGVPDELIAADYHQTERFTRRWLEAHEGAELPVTLLYTPPEAILRYLGQLRERHGSIERYLLAEGLDPAVVTALRA